MSVLELLGYTRKRIRGRRTELLLICLPPIAGILFFRLAETSFFSLLLYFEAMSPAELFTGGYFGQLIIVVLLTLLRWGIVAPLTCVSAVKLRGMVTDGSDLISASELLLNGSFVRRSIKAYVIGRAVSFSALIPASLSGVYIYFLLSDGGSENELFVAANMSVLAVLSVVFWLSIRLSMVSVPFILAEYPKRSPLSCVFMAFGFMRGRKRLLIALSALYSLPILTVIGIPFFLPELWAAFATGISIFIKEDEYARSAMRRVV